MSIDKQKLIEYAQKNRTIPESMSVRSEWTRGFDRALELLEGAIINGKFDSKTDYKAITELAVNALKQFQSAEKEFHYVWKIQEFAKLTLSEIERLQNAQT